MSSIALPGIMMACTASTAFASYFLKRTSDTKANSLAAFFTKKWLYFGIALYLAAAALNVLVLREADYSAVMPLASISYIWTLLIARLLLGERITWRKILGTALIVSGVVFVTMLKIW